METVFWDLSPDLERPSGVPGLGIILRTTEDKVNEKTKQNKNVSDFHSVFFLR